MMIPILDDSPVASDVPIVLRYVIKVPPRTRETFQFGMYLENGRLCKVGT